MPALSLAILFCYAPFCSTVADSFCHVRMNGSRIRFVGWENFQKLFSSESFYLCLKNTLVFTAWFVPLNLCVTFLMALLVHGKGKALAATQSMLMPTLAVAMGSVVLIMKSLFDEHTGLYTRIFPSLRWFSNPRAAMGMLVYTAIYLDFGFDFLLFVASLGNIPKELYEVAELEGACMWQKCKYLELPLSGPTLLFVVLTSMKDALLICAPVMILTEGGPLGATQTLVFQMYLEGFKSGNIALSSALSSVAFALSFIPFLIGMVFQRRRVFYQ